MSNSILFFFSVCREMLLRNHVFQTYRHYSSQSKKTKDILDRIIRVDHAGELGADRIYAGQMAVLGKILYFKNFWTLLKELSFLFF